MLILVLSSSSLFSIKSYSIEAHSHPAIKIKTSAFQPNQFASVSYDMTVKVWDWNPSSHVVRQYYQDNNHSEFVHGLDYSIHHPNLIATCGWDEMVHVFDIENKLNTGRR